MDPLGTRPKYESIRPCGNEKTELDNQKCHIESRMSCNHSNVPTHSS